MIDYDTIISKLNSKYDVKALEINAAHQSAIELNDTNRNTTLKLTQRLKQNYELMQATTDLDNRISLLQNPITDLVYSNGPSNVREHIERRAMTESAWCALHEYFTNPKVKLSASRERKTSALAIQTSQLQLVNGTQEITVNIPQKTLTPYMTAGLNAKQVGDLVSYAFSDLAKINAVSAAPLLSAIAVELGQELDYMTATPTRLQALGDLAQKVVLIRETLESHGASISYRDATILRNYEPDELGMHIEALKPISEFPGTTLLRLHKEAQRSRIALENLVERVTCDGVSAFDHEE